jgi:hypothetical protein
VAQRQLVLLSGDHVVFRFRRGDNFHSKLDGQKQEHWGFLVEINEFNMITSQDTIDFRKIDKVLVPGKPMTKRLGRKLVTAGVGLFVIDQLNITLIQHNKPNLDSKVWKTSALIASAGVPMLFFKKNWKKIGRGSKLISVGRDSRYYLPE